MSDKGLWTARFLIRAAIGVLIVAEVVLALGIALQAMAANPDAGFADWAYRNQDRLMGPFEDLFDDSEIGDGDGVIDWSGLFAMAVYGAIFIPLGMLLSWTRRAEARNEHRRQQAVEEAHRTRIFGGEPEPAPPAPPTIGERLRALFGRDEGQ